MTTAKTPVTAAAPRTDEAGWIAVGAIRGAFGVHGALKVEPYTDIESTVLNRLRDWRLDSPTPDEGRALAPEADRPIAPKGSRVAAGAGQRLPFPLPAQVHVLTCRQHGGFVIATIEPAISREQALALKGVEVLVHRAEFPATEPDEYYWADLIGCAVADPVGAPLGNVVALDDHGAQSVLRLDSGLLIPFVSAIILEVAPAEKRIVADWSADWR